MGNLVMGGMVLGQWPYLIYHLSYPHPSRCFTTSFDGDDPFNAHLHENDTYQQWHPTLQFLVPLIFSNFFQFKNEKKRMKMVRNQINSNDTYFNSQSSPFRNKFHVPPVWSIVMDTKSSCRVWYFYDLARE